MYFIYHLSTIVFGVFLIFFYLQKLLSRNSRSSAIVWVAYIIFGIGLMALNVVPVMPIVRTIYTWLGILVLCKVCYRSAPLNAVYVATVFCALALITELLCLKLLAIMGWEYLDVMSPGYERAIYILIAKVCQLALVIIAVPLMHREHSLLKLKSLLPLLACQIFSVYFCDEILRLTQNGGRKLSVESTIILIGILYLNIIIIVYAEVVKARQEERHNADLRQQQLELQLSYYDSLWKEQEQTRAMWHDMSKYLTAMKAVSVSGDKSSVEQVFLDAQDSLSKIGSVVDVGNPEVGAILQHYAQQANDLTVPLDLSVWVPQTLNINILDLSIIIGNTFENALEACLALPAQHRKISLEISVHNNLLLYEMSNPYIEGGKHRLHSGHSFHGYGIQNVQSVVDKYGSTLDIKQEGGMFRITLYLNLNPS